MTKRAPTLWQVVLAANALIIGDSCLAQANTGQPPVVVNTQNQSGGAAIGHADTVNAETVTIIQPTPPQPPPSMADLEFTLVADRRVGPDLLGRIEILNTGGGLAKLQNITVFVTGQSLEFSNGPQREIAPKRSIYLDISRPNGINISREVILSFDHAYSGSDSGRLGYVQFKIPEVLTSGQRIAPTLCCTREPADLLQENLRAAQIALAGQSGGFHVILPEKFEDGEPAFFMLEGGGKQFVWNFEFREVVLTAMQHGKQVVLRGTIADAPFGRHVVKGAWNDEDGFVALRVDGIEAQPFQGRAPKVGTQDIPEFLRRKYGTNPTTRGRKVN